MKTYNGELKGLTVLVGTALWCEACNQYIAEIRKVEAELGELVTFVEIDIEKNLEVVRGLNPVATPFTAIFNGTQLVSDLKYGAMEATVLAEFILLNDAIIASMQ